MNRLKTVWHLINLPCEGMTRLASESLDHDLGRLERWVLRSHLLYCAGCRRYARQIQRLRSILGQLRSRLESGAPLAGPPLPDDVRARIKDALADH